MPLPKPNQKEDKNKFIQRCMSDKIMQKEFPKHEQRLAVCYHQWSKYKKK